MTLLNVLVTNDKTTIMIIALKEVELREVGRAKKKQKKQFNSSVKGERLESLHFFESGVVNLQ